MTWDAEVEGVRSEAARRVGLGMADDSVLLLTLWQQWFAQYDDVVVVGVGASQDEALALGLNPDVDLMVVDQSIAGPGFGVIRALRVKNVFQVIVALSGDIDREGARRAGADFALDKADGPRALEVALEEARRRRRDFEA